MDLTQVLTIFVIVATNLITVVTLHIHSDNKFEQSRKDIQEDMKNFREMWAQETKDFHGRLIDLGERRNKLLEK